MVLVLFLAAVIWGIGAALKAPQRQRWVLIVLLYLCVVIAHLVLPEANALRATTGGRVEPWLALGAFGGVVVLYRRVLGRLRHRAAPVVAAAPERSGAFRDAELSRYSRHILLREIGGPGQARLKSARVLVVGAGGLGSPALLYLAAAGVGTIGVIDDDTVDGSNLQRQIIHRDDDIDTPKVQSAVAAMGALNPFITLRPYNRRLEATNAAALFDDYDLILDGSDSFATREVVNRAAVATGKPLIAGAITQWEGQISLYHPAAGLPCTACVFPHAPAPGLAPSCAEAGVAGPLPGVIGSMMALEAIKHIVGAGTGLGGRLMLYDALHAQTRTIKVARRADCVVCGAAAGVDRLSQGATSFRQTREETT